MLILHQHTDGIIHHRLIIDGQQLLAHPLGYRAKSGAGSPGEYDAFHNKWVIYPIFDSLCQFLLVRLNNLSAHPDKPEGYAVRDEFIKVEHISLSFLLSLSRPQIVENRHNRHTILGKMPGMALLVDYGH